MQISGLWHKFLSWKFFILGILVHRPDSEAGEDASASSRLVGSADGTVGSAFESLIFRNTSRFFWETFVSRLLKCQKCCDWIKQWIINKHPLYQWFVPRNGEVFGLLKHSWPLFCAKMRSEDSIRFRSSRRLGLPVFGDVQSSIHPKVGCFFERLNMSIHIYICYSLLYISTPNCCQSV